MEKRRIIEFFAIAFFILIAGLVFLKYYGGAGMSASNHHSVDQYVNYAELQKEISLQGIESQKPQSGLASSVTVINYHGITPQPTSGSVTVEQFKEQMFALKKAGYQTITLKDLYSFMQGKKSLPKNSILITFDDGRKDSYYNSDLILKALNYNAVMFVIAYYSLEIKPESKYYLNLSELKQMDNSGRWELQEHAYEGHGQIITGPNDKKGPFYGNKEWLAGLNRLETDAEYAQRITEDISKGKALLEQSFNKKITSFALPFGDYGQNTSNDKNIQLILSRIARQNFEMVFYQYKPAAEVDYRANYNSHDSNFYFAVRISVSPGLSSSELLKMVDASEAKSLPYSENFSNKYNWTASWGTYLGSGKSITLSSATGKTALAYIDGTFFWKDYSFYVSIKSPGQQTNSLIMRFQNSYNYATCSFDNNSINVELIRENKRSIVKTSRITEGLGLSGRQNVSLSASVSGNDISCFVDGVKMIEVSIPEIPANGGPGITLWSGIEGTPILSITKAEVLPVSGQNSLSGS